MEKPFCSDVSKDSCKLKRKTTFEIPANRAVTYEVQKLCHTSVSVKRRTQAGWIERNHGSFEEILPLGCLRKEFHQSFHKFR